jgi:EAL domain-containing protein (putative c-di-GMP-specific phosphodiesterase class I)/CheY-like chemotaxis protein
MAESPVPKLFESSILAVDDNPANTALLEQLLRRDGYTSITVCNDSRDVARLLDTLSPDLILLDLHMPHMDGFKILELIQYHAQGRYLPVIVITADTTRESTNRALGLGAHDFVSKPFDFTEIQLRVRNLLRARLAYKELHLLNSQLRDYVDVLESDSELGLDPWKERRARIEQVLMLGALRMVFQPIVDLLADTHVGYEALSRFDAEPVRSPDLWFLEATTVGLGGELETQALGNALMQFSGDRADQFVSVNLSPSAVLSDPSRHLGEDVDWSRVVIELTEHTSIDDYAPILAALKPLRDLGARLSVDDAGAGFASLRHILSLAPDFIKLDISMSRGIDRDPTRRALASALVTFARDIGSILIAEGIETEEERRVLTELGVRFGQGYLLGRPAELPDALLGN